MKNLVLFALVIGVAQAVSLTMLAQDDDWEAFKAQYGKKYANEVEEKFRKMIFMETVQRIAKHNKRETTFKQGINKFSDMLPTEFQRIMNGYRQDLRNRTTRVAVAANFVEDQSDTPESVDWRQQGAVTPVKDQGQCGSCWSFSTTGSLEGQTFIKTGNLVSLSEQNLIDCSGNYGNGGCDGGDQDQAFQYIKDNGGIDTEDNYPYEGKNDNCRYQSSNSGAEATGYTDLPQGDEGQLQQNVANVGPISVSIDASQDSFQSYSSGVYYEPDCSSSNLDHAVLVVGYGTDPDQGDYWLVKNSWGEGWGEQGYIRMSRNKNNNCGIASEATYPNV